MRIVFSDLDGTLLDHDTYSYKPAENAIDLLKRNHIPLIICTSKTRREIEYWKDELDINHPFISENGGAVFIPKNYFTINFLYHTTSKKYCIIELGTTYDSLLKKMKTLQLQYQIRSFQDMTIAEISQATNLEENMAKLAKKREYSIPFEILNKKNEKHIFKKINELNLRATKGGRFHHLMGNNDKGEALKILLYLYRKEFDEIITSIGIGDSENDFPMLTAVDRPYLVKKKDGSYASTDFNRADGIGPEGWKKAIETELKT